MQGIPIYDDINDLHILTGASIRTQNPLFHCFDMDSVNDLPNTQIAPHRVTFFTLAISMGTRDLTYTLNEQEFEDPQDFVLCVAPGQVATWEKRGTWSGFCSFFKSEFLQVREQVNFLVDYPFFNIQENNLIPLMRADYEELSVLFEHILNEQKRGDTFAEEIIRFQFQTILWKVRRIYEASFTQKPKAKAGAVVASQFQYLVNEHFLSRTTVEEYAELLNLSPNYLSQSVRRATGKPAKKIITERRLSEAKYLLTYTENTVAEIAYHLKFIEPTHFTKFFKKAVHASPLEYRLYYKRT